MYILDILLSNVDTYMQIDNIRQYTDISYLQRGGMSYILKGKNKYTEQYYVIKLSIDKHKQSHLNNESKILGKINHKNIVRLFEVNDIKNVLFIVLELLEGQTLQDHIDTNGIPSYDTLLRIFKEVCGGVAYLHKLDIVHRDLKPRNIFLCNNGDVKILDFGLSVVLNEPYKDSKSKIIGTIDHISPAQILYPNNIEKRFDIYSLASILYFMSTGKLMFTNKSLNKKIRNKIFGYFDVSSIDNLDIKELIQLAMSQYNTKKDDINHLLNIVEVKDIINQWNYVKN